MTAAIETTIRDVLGAMPWTGADGLTLTSETRPAARTFVSRMGVKADVMLTLTLDELKSLYSDADAFKSRFGYGDPTQAEQIATAPYAPKNRDLLIYLTKKGDAKPAPARKAEPVAPIPSRIAEPKAPAPAGDKAAQLAALIADLAGDKAAPLDEARVIELVKQHAPKPTEQVIRHVVTIETKTPAEPRTLPSVPRHSAFPEVLAAVSASLNVMLVGPAGAGKTHLCAQVAEALETGFRFTGALDSPYKLLGFTDAQGRTVRTPYRETYEHGGVFLFDEIDASAPAALLAFNAGLANGQQDFPDECIKRHETARFIASANTYGRGQDRVYVGRNQLDAASLDRFAVIAMDYDTELEAALFGKTDWLAYVHKVRAAVASLNIRHVVSMRAIEQGTKLLAAGLDRDRVEALALWKGLDAATVAKIKAEAK